MQTANTAPHVNRTICIRFCQENYEAVVDDPVLFRRHVDQNFKQYPELFPENMGMGYQLKDQRETVKLKETIRRISVSGFSIVLRDRIGGDAIPPYRSPNTLTDDRRIGVIIRSTTIAASITNTEKKPKWTSGSRPDSMSTPNPSASPNDVDTTGLIS